MFRYRYINFLTSFFNSENKFFEQKISNVVTRWLISFTALIFIPILGCLLTPLISFKMYKQKDIPVILIVISMFVDLLFPLISIFLIASLLTNSLNLAAIIFAYLGMLLINSCYLLAYFLRYGIFLYNKKYRKKTSFFFSVFFSSVVLLFLSISHFVLYPILYLNSKSSLSEFESSFLCIFVPILVVQISFIHYVHKNTEKASHLDT